jgi:hypothetical protein
LVLRLRIIPSAASWDNSRSAEKGFTSADITPFQSARGLAQSKTLRAIRWSSVNAPASWTAVALHRFFMAHPNIQTSFVQPKPILAAVLATVLAHGYCLRRATGCPVDLALDRAGDLIKLYPQC